MMNSLKLRFGLIIKTDTLLGKAVAENDGFEMFAQKHGYFMAYAGSSFDEPGDVAAVFYGLNYDGSVCWDEYQVGVPFMVIPSETSPALLKGMAPTRKELIAEYRKILSDDGVNLTGITDADIFNSIGFVVIAEA